MELFSPDKNGLPVRAPNDDVAQPWFTACVFDIEHPCYGQLTPGKTRYLLTSVM